MWGVIASLTWHAWSMLRNVGCNSIVGLARMVDATDGGVGWGVIASLTWHAWSMLRNRWDGGVDACAALLRFQILLWYALECFICIS